MKNNKDNKTIKKIIAVVFWVIVWQVVSIIVKKPLLFPSVKDTLIRLAELMRTIDFWLSIGYSFLNISIGVIFALIIGLIGGILSGYSKLFNTLFNPILYVIKSTPVASFIVLLIIWINRNIIPTIICILTILPMIWYATYEGIKSVDQSLYEVCKVYKFSFSKRLKYLYLPSVKPYVISAFYGCIGIALKSAIAAEVITLPLMSIGRQMYYSANNLDTAGTFAWTLMIIILSVFINYVFLKLTKKIEEKGRTNDD